ncbi:PREDICTED: protein KBP homolog [Nicrophorus vespilloides]|uniref:KIF-binding protein n=1 Tax=Nicrophorus vespilloides TaxID=110193 RepID=A0ABM1MZC4_NICVS|nr:PREDICTED: protein KBP homolog [Nicrophorus vespilloides]
MITKESLGDLQEKFEKVKKLVEEDARFDPETQPYFSKYSARQNLISMNALIENLKEKQGPDSPDYPKLIGMHGTVKLNLGMIAVDTEELTIGEKHFQECAKIIEGFEDKLEVASVNLHMLNQLGTVWARWDYEKGQEHLEKADSFYKQIKESGLVPIDCNDIFNVNYELNEEDAMKKFEKLYTLTLYYLAQVYSLKDPVKSAIFCHKTLQRQLESNDYEEIDWILNTATLSQFLMEKNGFKQARHHLSASWYMLDEHKKKLDAIVERDDEYFAKLETYQHRFADVARCWGKYGLVLLVNSRDRLVNTSDIDATASICTDISKLNITEELTEWDFPTLELSKYEEEVTDQFVLTIEDAKKVFLNAQKWLNRAQEYYSLESLASDYIEIAQDYSKLYDALVFYEENPDNRSKLIKRAIDVLEQVLSEVNPTYYMQYCRPIWFRLGMLYSDLIDIKLDRIKESTARPNPHALKKINALVDKSLKHFNSFVDSFKNSSGELPKKMTEDMEKPFLQAYFHLAVLQTRHITLDKNVQLKNTEESMKFYKMFVDYCNANESAVGCVKEELSVAKEMVTLLPLKIAKLRNELPLPR